MIPNGPPRAVARLATADRFRRHPASTRARAAASREMVAPFGEGKTSTIPAGALTSDAGDREYPAPRGPASGAWRRLASSVASPSLNRQGTTSTPLAAATATQVVKERTSTTINVRQP